MHLLAQPSPRPDAHDVADKQHADYELRVDRGSTDRAVVRPQVAANAGKVDEAIDPAQQVIDRHMRLERELAEHRALQAGLYLEYDRTIVFFTWEGFEEMDEVRRSGPAELLDEGSPEIEFACHLGNEAVLRAERETSSTAC